jgi:hypothetical protein
MKMIAAGLEFQQRLAEELFRGSLNRHMKRAEMLPDQGPTSPSDPPRYPAGPDYVIEVALLELQATAPALQNMRYRFILRARGRLVRVADGTVMEEFIQEQATDLGTVEKWTEDRGKPFQLQFERATWLIARAFLDRWIPAAGKPTR